jgi:enoyl-CoA hydratase/carnithine racemase
MKTQYGEVSVARDGHIAVLEVDRPPTNFVSVDMMAALSDALEDLDTEDAIRATVLTTAGKAFCAGADLAAPSGLGGPNAMRGINQLYVEAVRLFSIRKPIVCAVQGAAVGAGLGLTLIADFRVAAPEARFTSNFVKLGFHPGFGITHTLPRVVGWQKAQLMCLTGRRVTGEQAYAWGLADELAPLDKLRDTAAAMAREIAENAPLAVESTRATFRADLAAAVKAQTDHEHIEQTRLRATKDFAEGVRSVNERRLGNFIRA